ncbi:vesicular, overexpressed in cancer, prosurvival protein 1 isoform X2 [Xyrauchen texanus]|uniref:vesicular, overexpressed in cancer, prosurvival protein 1 isoform X2 n=1 Tax=Xyrauchen texanus TaxID=154827 RepID=UPI0022419DA1|nr:vesicular, overexpressed in cancer, prosurvival protein 1 isoform X2 [Xyrauchen texanus]
MREIYGIMITVCLIAKTIAEKKYCWYFEGGYPVYFICKTYEDCCGTQCCVRALSIQRIWYFWLLLMIGILCCCSAGYFIRRRLRHSSPPGAPDFKVAFTRHPIISQDWLSELWRLRDCSHFNCHPSADSPQSHVCSVLSPAVPLQPASTSL